MVQKGQLQSFYSNSWLSICQDLKPFCYFGTMKQYYQGQLAWCWCHVLSWWVYKEAYDQHTGADKNEHGWEDREQKRLNNKGLRTEPWGTPDCTGIHPDEAPLNWTRWERFKRKDEIHVQCHKGLQMPNLCNLPRRIEWLTLLKALRHFKKKWH